MTDVIPFPVPKTHMGNGAREALARVLDEECDVHPPEGPKYQLDLRDRLLAALWIEGFKVVPLDGSEV